MANISRRALAALSLLLAPTLAFAQPGQRIVVERLWTRALAADCKGGMAIGDVDGDGRPEVLFGTYFGDEHLYCLGGARGELRWKHRSDGGPFDASVLLIDVDGDGVPEALTADSARGGLRCVDGKTGKARWTIQLPSGTDSPPSVADLDGDGQLSLVAGSMWRPRRRGDPLVGALSAYHLGRQRLAMRWSAAVPGCVQTAGCAVDLDGDGKDELICASWRGDRGVHCLGPDGKRRWRVETRGGPRSVGMYHGPSVAGRGATLRLIVATGDGDVLAIRADGEVAWTRRFAGEYLFAPTAAGDLTGDGRDEVIVCGRRTAYCLSAASGETLWQRALPGSSPRGAALADLDGDGRPEVALAAGRRLLVLDGKRGQLRVDHDCTLKGQAYESIDTQPVIADLDGDGAPELVIVIGRGTSTNRGRDNYGQVICLTGFRGQGRWPTFRGNNRRTGRAPRVLR